MSQGVTSTSVRWCQPPDQLLASLVQIHYSPLATPAANRLESQPLTDQYHRDPTLGSRPRGDHEVAAGIVSDLGKLVERPVVLTRSPA